MSFFCMPSVAGDSVGDCVVGASVGGDSVGDCVGGCAVGAFVGGDSFGACVVVLASEPAWPELGLELRW